MNVWLCVGLAYWLAVGFTQLICVMRQFPDMYTTEGLRRDPGEAVEMLLLVVFISPLVFMVEKVVVYKCIDIIHFVLASLSQFLPFFISLSSL